jgi:protein-S-isoprenylcysteine O-methyltransferase Ste14
VAYLTVFQIIPEEQAMLELFEAEFVEYKKTVRRWI